MTSVYSEIKKIRHDQFFKPIENITNRYCVLCQEPLGVKTAYCFSVPIRNVNSNDIVDLEFRHHNQYSAFSGSNCRIIVSDRIKIANEHGQCDITTQCKLYKKTDTAIFFKGDTGEVEMRPTLNGFVLFIDNSLSYDNKRIKMRIDQPLENTRTNNKYFSIMREKFIPFVTVSCIGMINSYGKICSPCEVFAQKSSDNEYVLNFCGDNSQNRIAVEINMQEPKLFQDTTVESMNPTVNNAFGGISFLGTSKPYGEQWLYSRLDISNLAHIQGKKIIKSILHIPRLGYKSSPITVSEAAKRFCSFGSNWENKIAVNDTTVLSSESLGYYHLDITNILGNFRNKSENFVIRGSNPEKTVIIPTGDCFYSPQILEVKYQ